MTSEQKTRIANYRNAGYSYGRIAKAMGIKATTIKAHCQRFGLKKPERFNANSEYAPCCKNCGKALTLIPGRKPKQFCSDRCRNTWWSAHMDQVKRKAFYDFICPTCGTAFSAYGNSHRKYCCHSCYITARFGQVRNWEKTKISPER